MNVQAATAREAARNTSNGQFGEQRRADPGVQAIAADWRATSTVRTADEVDDDGLSTFTEEQVHGDAEFQRRCRRILGVTDDTIPVQVLHSESGSNPWGCDTWEYYEDVTVRCGGHQLVAHDLPELFRRLDAADLPRMDEQTARLLHADAAVITARAQDGRRITGRVVNFNGWQVLIDDGTRYGCRLDFKQVIGFTQGKDPS